MSAFPRLPPVTGAKSLEELQRYLYEYAIRMAAFFKLQPPCEHKAISSTGVFPVFVSTVIDNPVEVRRCQTYETRNTAAGVSDVSIAWLKSTDPNQPGIVISAMGGLTAGTQYTVVLAIEGER